MGQGDNGLAFINNAIGSVMQGASAVSNGVAGLAPKPLAGEQYKFLRASGAYELAPFIDINNALTFTASGAGNNFKTVNTNATLGTNALYLVNFSWSSLENSVAGWYGNAIGFLKPIEIVNGFGGGYRMDLSYMSHTNNSSTAGSVAQLDILRILTPPSTTTLILSIYPGTYTLKLIPIYNMWFL